MRRKLAATLLMVGMLATSVSTANAGYPIQVIRTWEQPNSNPTYNLTIDQIFPPAETASLLAVAGNSSSYIFLGSSNSFLQIVQTESAKSHFHVATANH